MSLRYFVRERDEVMTHPLVQLGMIEVYTRHAREAFNDKSEANFNYYVSQLVGIAKNLEENAKELMW